MRLNSKWLAVLLLLAVIPLSGCSFMQKAAGQGQSE